MRHLSLIARAAACVLSFATLHAADYAYYTVDTTKTVKGSNDSAAWTAVSAFGTNGIPATAQFKSLQTMPSNPNYPTYGRMLFVGTHIGLYRSIDGGVSFSEVSLPGSGLEGTSKIASALLTALNANNQYDILVGMTGTTNGGVFVSGNLGRKWRMINQGFDPNTLSISTLVKTSCSGCAVSYYSGSYGGGLYTMTTPVVPAPTVTGWCFGSSNCTCSTAAPSGPAAGGQSFKICGTGFASGAVVEFDWLGVKNIQYALSCSAGVCTATSNGGYTDAYGNKSGTPAHAPAQVRFNVRNMDTREGFAAVAYSFQ